jgi:hypothetical protein
VLAAEMGREDTWHQRTPEEINQLKQQTARIDQMFTKLRSMSFEQVIEHFSEIGAGFVIDLFMFKALACGVGKVAGTMEKVQGLKTALAEQASTATTSITSGKEAATTAKLIADHGPDGARKILNIVKENPGLVQAEG